MKLNKILFLITFLLLAATAKGALTDGLMAYYSFEGNAQDNTSNNRDASTVGGNTNFNTAGIIGKAAAFDGSGDYIAIPNPDLAFSAETLQTITCWIKPSTIDENMHFIVDMWKTGTNRWGIGVDTALDAGYDVAFSNAKVTGYSGWKGMAKASTTQWHFIAFVRDGGNIVTNHNNTLIRVFNSTVTGDNQGNDPLTFGGPSNSVNTNNYAGLIDECGFWNRSLSYGELTQLYNNHNGQAYPFSTPTPTITLSSDIYSGNAGFLRYPTGNFSFNYNGTFANGAGKIYNVTIIGTRHTGFAPPNDVVRTIHTYTDVDLSSNQNDKFSFVGYEAFWNFTITAQNNNASNNFTSNAYLDGINPEISYSGIQNGSTYFKHIDPVIDFSVTAADNNLEAFNVTLRNASDGSILFQNLTQSISTQSLSQIYAINLSNNRTGEYQLVFEAWDDHTAQEIKDFNVKRQGNKLTFDEIEILALDEADLSYSREKDRYSFGMKFKAKKDHYLISLKSPNKLKYVADSPYKGHFVDLQSGKWIDFEDGIDSDVSIFKISEKEYTIAIKPKNGEKDLTFHSIGSLNYVATMINFSYADDFFVYAHDNATAVSLTEYGIEVNTGSAISRITTNTGTLISNITGGPYDVTVFAPGYINRTFSGLIMAPGGSINASINASGAFTVYVRDEITLSKILQKVDLEFIPVTANESKNYSTSIGVKYISDLPVGEYILRYSSANYSHAFYYFTLENNTNSEFTIYMLPASMTSNVTGYVYSEVSNPVSGAYIHVQRYSISTNSYITVEILKTNFEGRAVMHVTKNTEFYKFLIFYNGELKQATEPTYIYDDELTFGIQLGSEIAENFFEVNGIFISLDFNEATKNFKYTWADEDNTIQNASLFLYNVTNGVKNLVNMTSISSTSGTILLHANNRSGTTYQAVAYVVKDDVLYWVGSEYYEYPAEPRSSDKQILFYVVLLMMLFACIGFWDLSIAMILTPLPLLGFSVLGMIPVPVYVTVPIEILAIILAYVMGRAR